MLLIAMPKSASTSLATTIVKMCGLRLQLGIGRKKKDVDCKGFKSIQKLHSNMIERSELFLKQEMKGRKTLFKEHILPSASHLKRLSKYREGIIVLLRNPEKAYEAYERVGAKVNEGIKKDLVNFHNKYMWWASNKPNVLVIYFEDLILNYHSVMKRIIKHYGLKAKKIIPLMKKKYTGIGAKEVREQHESEKQIQNNIDTINKAAESLNNIIKDKEEENVTDSTT